MAERTDTADPWAHRFDRTPTVGDRVRVTWPPSTMFPDPESVDGTVIQVDEVRIEVADSDDYQWTFFDREFARGVRMEILEVRP